MIYLILVLRSLKYVAIAIKLIDRLRATRWTPPDYWQTDNSNRLVMVIRNYHWLNSASQVLISTCSAPLVQTGERKQTHTVWPWPLTYNLDVQSQASEGQDQLSCQKSRSKVKRFKQESAHRQTDGHTHTHTHGRYQTYYRPCYAVDNQFWDKICEIVRPRCIKGCSAWTKVSSISRTHSSTLDTGFCSCLLASEDSESCVEEALNNWSSAWLIE